MEEHLARCETCSAELADLRTLTTLLARLPAHQPPRSFVLGPRALRPAALSGTAGGVLRALTSLAAAAAVVAVSLSLIFQGLPRQTVTAAAASLETAPATVPRTAVSAARTASSPFVPARPAAPAAQAAARPSIAPSAPPVGAAVPARAAAPAPQAAPVTSASSPALTPPARATPVNVPRLAGELGLLLIALGLVVYSLRWWRR